MNSAVDGYGGPNTQALPQTGTDLTGLFLPAAVLLILLGVVLRRLTKRGAWKV